MRKLVLSLVLLLIWAGCSGDSPERAQVPGGAPQLAATVYASPT